MPEILCLVRIQLSENVSKAVQAVYQAKYDLSGAVRDRLSLDSFSLHLTEARKAERNAVKLLDEHRKQHQC